ncbi:MAG: hypothetical protein Q9227_000846 [Pyrenula ochraceoflavens]
MYRQAIVASVLTALLTGALVTAIPAPAPIPGYKVEHFTWEVEPHAGAKPLVVSGTVQDVYAAASKINPNFEAERCNHTSASKRDIVEATASPSESNLNCDEVQGWHGADLRYIQDGLKHLRGLEGYAASSPGPGTCGRVSCSYASAIWWCNDVPILQNINPMKVAWEAISNSVDYSISNCPLCPGGGPYDAPCIFAQNFMPKGWNTIIRSDDC